MRRRGGTPATLAKAWKRIHTRTTRAPYVRFCEQFPDSPYAKESQARQQALYAWHYVDKTDPIDIYYFLLRGPFDALRMLAETTLDEATQKAPEKHREDYWRQVGIPFYPLSPLLPLVYVAVIAAASLLYALTAHPLVSHYFPVVVEAARRALESLQGLDPKLPQPALEAATLLATHIVQIVRIALTALRAIACGFLLLIPISMTWSGWLEPRIRDIREKLDHVATARFEVDA